MSERENPSITISEKIDNTLTIMACIGTISDVVNLMDANSLNREIVKKVLTKLTMLQKKIRISLLAICSLSAASEIIQQQLRI